MIERHEGRQQVVCDFCPASVPATFAEADFALMIEDAKGRGWLIRKAEPKADARDTSDLFGRSPHGEPVEPAGQAKPQPYTHACPVCSPELSSKGKPAPQGRLL